MRLATVLWNQDERRLRAGWRILLVTTVCLLAGIAWAGVQAVTSQFGVPSALTETLGLALWLGILVVAGRWIDRRTFSQFGFRFDIRWGMDLVFGLVLGGALMGAVVLGGWAAGLYRVQWNGLHPPEGPTWGMVLLQALLFIRVGVMEEMWMRGYLMQNLAEGLRGRSLSARESVLVVWGCTAVLFAALHAANPGASWHSTANVAVAGLLLGAGRVLTGSLAIPIGLHVAWNWAQGPLLGLPVSGNAMPASLATTTAAGPVVWTGGSFGPEGGLPGLAATLAGIVLVGAWVRGREGALGVGFSFYRPPADNGTDRLEARAYIPDSSADDGS
jgi:uncharacterized protein